MDGYLTFIDQIGHYMEVKEVEGIVIGDLYYSGAVLSKNFNSTDHDFGTIANPTELGTEMILAIIDRFGIAEAKDSEGNLKYPTYEARVKEARDIVHNAFLFGQLSYESDTKFSNYIGWYADKDGNYCGFWHESHTAADRPADAKFINKSYGLLGDATDGHKATDMMYVSIQVHTEIATGNTSMIWRIPASLIPVVSYNVSFDGDTVADATNIKIEYDAAEPIRLLFEVGLREDINLVNVAGKITDKEAHIIDEDKDGISDDGKYYFYTNWWDDHNLSHDEAPIPKRQ